MTVINFQRNDCRKIHSYLDAYLDGDLPRETLQEVLQHLENCQKYELELAAREQVKKPLQQVVKKDVAPFGLQQRIQKNLRKPDADSPGEVFQWGFAVG